MSVVRSSFVESTATKDGTLYLSDASASVTASAVRCLRASEATVEATAGGAAMLTDGATATLTDTLVANCAARRGGGVQMESTASAPRGPGTTDTYSISSAPTLTLDGANFSNCSASVAGGGIDGIGTAALRVEIVIKNSTLSGSESVGGSGGGVAIADGILSLRQSVIESSTAAYGASIHASSASSVSLNSSTVRAGNATADGGGIFLAGASSVLLADGSLMADNVAGSGGAHTLPTPRGRGRRHSAQPTARLGAASAPGPRSTS